MGCASLQMTIFPNPNVQLDVVVFGNALTIERLDRVLRPALQTWYSTQDTAHLTPKSVLPLEAYTCERVYGYVKKSHVVDFVAENKARDKRIRKLHFTMWRCPVCCKSDKYNPSISP